MNSVFSVELFYVIAGAVFASVAWRALRNPRQPRRWGSVIFWLLLAVIYLFGKALPPAAVGYGVLAMVALAALRQVEKPASEGASREERAVQAERLGEALFAPALLIPVTAVVGALLLSRIHFGEVWLLDKKQATLAALGIGGLIALGAGLRITGAKPAVPVAEGSRLLQAIGWALVLPQMLAALGGIFAQAGVGQVVAELVASALPTQYPFVAVAAYCVGMALFTMCMGNAFAAFPVITLGIGLPLIVQQHHGNVAIMAGIGMLSGYCGTLMTPMAANFNIVPAMLLELRDKNAVIRAQVPLALTILAANIAIMYLCVFRF
ncbi:MAG: DUF979 domain-containing protein [Candidatus Didemnitutus sp.]|nr:DUF979 domain-containing protein [Candidatus Didemnitutus sp.]